MDLAALVGAGVVGAALAVSVVGLVVRDRRLTDRLAATERIVGQLKNNTVTRESLMTEAEERYSRRVLHRAALRDLMDSYARDCGGDDLLTIVEEIAPHEFQDRVA